jgi:hypothetical protein
MEKQLNKQIQVGLKDGTPVKCVKCSGSNFMPLVRFFKFSALLTGSPKDSLMPIEVYVCGQCGETLDELLPNELKQSKPKIDLNNITIQS